MHRWLGIAGSLLFVVWFVSGMVMMYAGMPSLTTEERLSRLPRLDLSQARVDVSEAAVRVGVAPRRIVVGMLGDRPVYRFTGAGGVTTVYADTGAAFDGLDAEAAEAEDADRVFALGEEVYTACNNCHMLYWVDDADRGRAIESPSGGAAP